MTTFFMMLLNILSKLKILVKEKKKLQETLRTKKLFYLFVSKLFILQQLLVKWFIFVSLISLCGVTSFFYGKQKRYVCCEWSKKLFCC